MKKYLILSQICGGGIIIIFIFTFFYHYLIKHSILCSNDEIKEVILPTLCQKASETLSLFITGISEESQISSRNLCSILCSSRINISCHTYHLNKPFVFTVHYTTDAPRQLVVKSIIEEEEDEDAYWYQKRSSYVPSVAELQTMVDTHISSFIGRHQDGSLKEIRSVLLSVKVNDLEVHEEFWKYLYDHEFLISYLFQDFSVFPKIYGTCGKFYGVEYAQPLIVNPLLPISIPLRGKIAKAIELVRLVEKLEVMWFEPIHLCDVKHDHFGWNSRGEVLFLDLDCVVTESSLKSIMLSTPQCTTDEDCSYFDCHGHCLFTSRCSGKRLNTNLQTLCNKLFLGKSDSSVLPLAGLLLDLKISNSLKETLELCSANPVMTASTLVSALEAELKSLQFSHYEL